MEVKMEILEYNERTRTYVVNVYTDLLMQQQQSFWEEKIPELLINNFCPNPEAALAFAKKQWRPGWVGGITITDDALTTKEQVLSHLLRQAVGDGRGLMFLEKAALNRKPAAVLPGTVELCSVNLDLEGAPSYALIETVVDPAVTVAEDA